MATEQCEYVHREVRDAAQACTIANREMWDLVSVVNDPAVKPRYHGRGGDTYGDHEYGLIAFYRVPRP